MAQVTMDITELDSLRQRLKDGEAELKKLNEEIANVKSDKRVVERIEIPTIDQITFTLDENQINYDRQKSRSMDFSLKKYINNIRLVGKPRTQFINFEDVKKELKDAMELEYSTELAELRTSKRNLDGRVAEKDVEIREEKNKYVKHIETLKKEHSEIIVEWQKKYKELKTGKEELSRIEELEKDVRKFSELYCKEKQKSWWTKLWKG